MTTSMIHEGAATPRVAAQTEASFSEAGGARRVLLVEDDVFVADSTQQLISILGHKVLVASSGAQALALARDFTPELVLCDIGLPGGMDGYAVVRAMRRDPSLAPARIVALSGYGNVEAVEKSRAAGFDLHLTKPVAEEVLERLLTQ
jgi:CheY-like chemotaxis protein